MEEILNSELKSMTPEQLKAKENELRSELLQLRLRSASSPVKSFATDQRKLKQAIARVLTWARQKELDQARGANESR